MDSIDKEIRELISRQRQASGPGKRALPDYPTERDFYLLVTGSLPEPELKKMLAHLGSHPQDQALVVTIRGLLARMAEAEKQAVPEDLLGAARSRIPQKEGLSCPYCQKPITPFKKPLGKQKLFNFLWLAAGLFFLGLSFWARHFFVQWSILGGLCLIQWIVDRKATKTQILIYKALSEDAGEKTRHLHRAESHL